MSTIMQRGWRSCILDNWRLFYETLGNRCSFHFCFSSISFFELKCVQFRKEIIKFNFKKIIKLSKKDYTIVSLDSKSSDDETEHEVLYVVVNGSCEEQKRWEDLYCSFMNNFDHQQNIANCGWVLSSICGSVETI